MTVFRSYLSIVILGKEIFVRKLLIQEISCNYRWAVYRVRINVKLDDVVRENSFAEFSQEILALASEVKAGQSV